jgi:hypothetical protein
VTEEEVTAGRSLTLTSFDKREFLRSFELKEDQFAEAGTVGVLKTCLFSKGDIGDVTEEDDEAVVEGMADLPTKDFSVAIIAGYS